MTAEANTYQPTEQEICLRKRFTTDGSHDLLQTLEHENRSVPFAFDLSREYQFAQKYGKNYKKYFIENAHYYAKESYGRVPVSEYEHKILGCIDGNVQLALGPDNLSARESYLVPALDRSKPDWHRRRSMGDVRWADEMEKLISEAEDGDTFIDLSPTEFGVSVEERKKWGFGYHSFVRIHRVVTENGQKKLVSRAVRNYLDQPEQSILFKQLTGEEVDLNEILGKVEKVSPDISQAYISTLSDALYDATPHERKIVPPPEHMKNIKNEIEMNKDLSKIDTWLEVIYEMMERGETPSLILKEFRGWENAVRDYVEGKDILPEFEQASLEEMRMAVYMPDSLLKGYTERPYEAGTNGCGLGSGFSETEKKQEGMTYESMTKVFEKDCPEIKCGNKKGNCKWKASESEVNAINAGRLKNCPRCGWKP